jgi:hypothetical protein
MIEVRTRLTFIGEGTASDCRVTALAYKPAA